MTVGKKVAYCAMLTALAMIFSYVEVLIPINFGVPGMKLGVANLVTVVAFTFLKPREVFLIIIVRILLVGLLFGNGASILYSLAGGILSFAVMACLNQWGKFSLIGISMVGGIAHNVGQIVMAVLIVQNSKIFYYLPVLVISGTVTGVLIGVVGSKIRDSLRPETSRVVENI